MKVQASATLNPGNEGREDEHQVEVRLAAVRQALAMLGEAASRD